MAFRFSLAAVLRLREIHEQREERALTETLAQVAHARELLLTLEEQMERAAGQREAGLQRQMSAAELQDAYGLAALLKEQRQVNQKRLVELEHARDEQIKIYQAAHRDREVLSKMQQQQRESFLLEQSRRQQKVLDDSFIARMVRR